MVFVRDLMSEELLVEMIEQGYIRSQSHPTLPLDILNYTAKAQYDNVWNPATLQCRGLIVDRTTLKVVARPFPKFFNLSQVDPETIPRCAYEVWEKMDGSLGILYPTDEAAGIFAIATRGSFTSDQAVRATKIWLEHYQHTGNIRPVPGRSTMLFEIIYPENRIVVDYGDTTDITLIDVLDNDTGASIMESFRPLWHGPVAKVYQFVGGPFASMWRPLPPKSNAEGVVIKFADGTRLKVKHDEYIELHRILTNVSSRTIWEYLREGVGIQNLIEHTPDEFHGWVAITVDKILAAYRLEFTLARQAYLELLDEMDKHHRDKFSKEDRKEFARRAMSQLDVDSSLLFNLLDNKDITDKIWDKVRPELDYPFKRVSEDAA